MIPGLIGLLQGVCFLVSIFSANLEPFPSLKPIVFIFSQFTLVCTSLALGAMAMGWTP